MGIVVNQTPQAYMPAFNQQIFQATSSNYSQPNHTFTVVVTDLITGAAQTRQISADPVYFSMYFDAMPFSKDRVQHYIPLNGATGFQLALNGIRKIRVNVGETYGTTLTYYPGSNFDYIIWNASIDFLKFGAYNYTDYVYNTATSNYKYFAGVTDDLTFTDRSNFIYCLSTGTGDLTQLLIKTYDASGTLLGSTVIPNPYASSPTYTNKYVAIDVGYKGLNGISSGLVTGTFPIITASVARYEVYDNTNMTFPILIKKITIGCDNRFSVKTVHYMARNGSFNTCNFNLISEKKLTRTGQIYKRNPNTRAATSYTYSQNDATDFDFNITTQTALTLRTDWLTDEQVTQYKSCFSSPKCYLDEGLVNSVRIRPVTGDYQDLPRYERQLTQLQMDYFYSHQDHRQDV